MRLNKLLVVALAGMTMFSCSNDDEPGNGASNGEKKTVVLKLDGIKSAKTRSTDGNTTGAENKAAMTVHDVTVVLYSNENKRIVLVDEIPYLKDGNTNPEWTTLTTSNGKHYANVDASANRVLVLGNVAEKEGIHSLLTKGANVQDVLDYGYLLKEENQKKGTATSPDDETSSNTKNYVTLYDNQALVEDGTVADNTHSDQGNKLYKATLTIKPLVSRFEVKKVGCQFIKGEGDNTLYKEITLKGIGLVDYYTKATVSTDGIVTATDAMHGISESETTTDPGIYSPLYAGDVPDGSYKFCDDNFTEWDWTFDIIGGDAGITITNGNTNDPTYFKDGEKDLQFAYNFFPMHNENDIYNTPNVRLYVDAKDENGDVNEAKHFVVTTSMRDASGNALVPERGKIYQFDYVFKEKNIGKWEEKISVEVEVTVADWVIETVTPGFPD